MKKIKLFLFLSIMLLFFRSEQTMAQISSVSISTSSDIDSINYNCVPSDLTYYVTGTVTGTLSVTIPDSLTVKFFYGDGTFSSYKIPLDSGKHFSIYKSWPKTYTTAGTYTTKVIITAASGVADSLSSSPFTLSTSCSITALDIDSSSQIDSLAGLCSATKLYYYVVGSVSGTVGKLDSLTVFFDYGDGTTATYKLPLARKKFYAYKYGVHTYTTAGTYSTKVIVTAPSGATDSLISAPFAIITAGSGISATRLTAHGSTDSSDALCKLPHRYTYGAWGSITGCPIAIDSATINFNFGDGTDTTIKVKISSSGTYYTTGHLSHSFTIAGSYTPRVTVVTTRSAAKDTVFLSSITLTDSCATIKGHLYVDDNGNCIKNTGEGGVWYIPIRIINTATGDTSWVLKWSDIEGYYSVDLAAGTYNITPMINRTFGFGWIYSKGDTLKPTCPTTGSITMTALPLTTYTRDFAYQCTPVDSFDAQVVVSSNCYVPGDTAVMKVWAGDWWRVYYYNCLSLSSTLSLTLDADLTYAGHLDGKVPSSIVGKVITWNISGSDLALFTSRVKVAVATTAVAGDTLVSTAYIAPATGIPDYNISNNTQNYARIVVSSFDPNNKEAAPNGKGKEGFIPTNTPMTYTINFQNTGTAPARNITIVDSLESDIEASSFHMITSTHNAVVYKEGKVLKFRFNDIYLPDSGSNYYGSMGSVTFGVLPIRDLAPGTEIKNRANIYFDYNDPIITNYALNTIEYPTNIQKVTFGSIEAKVFPNPTNTALNIKVENNASITVTMMDMLGRTVANESSDKGNISIAAQNLAAGMYLLNIRDAAGNQQNTKVMVKH
jgi:hypothetical protein